MVGWDADPELLRTFLAVRRHKNLTRAAEELLVTQPAVSRRLARLERALGLPLFERLGRTLHLTEAGEALAGGAADLIGSAERLAEAVRARRSGERGLLRVGASTTPGLYLLPRVLLEFGKRNPQVEVRFAVENSLQIEEKIVRNDLDLGLVGAHLTHASLRLRPVLEDEIVCYAGLGHPLAGRTSVAPRDLEGEVCLVREPGSATRRLFDDWLRRSRARLARTVDIHCPEAAKALVRAGFGFSYVSAHGLEGDGGAGLARLPVAGLRLRRPLHLVLHADKRLSPAMRSFLSLAASMLKMRGAPVRGRA